jgi:hypothetical protein
MDIEKRLLEIEDKQLELSMVIDGSEDQTQEAAISVVGLLVAFLAKKGMIDYGELIAFLDGAVDPDLATEDHVGLLVDRFKNLVDFHRMDDLGLLVPYVSVADRLAARDKAGPALRE